MMKSVFVVQHLHVLAEDREEVKLIGVYSSLESAEEAVQRMRTRPGFQDHPRIVDALKDDDKNGFYIDEYPLDRDNWAEGYVTV